MGTVQLLGTQDEVGGDSLPKLHPKEETVGPYPSKHCTEQTSPDSTTAPSAHDIISPLLTLMGATHECGIQENVDGVKSPWSHDMEATEGL
jgi:hypothetical protein